MSIKGWLGLIFFPLLCQCGGNGSESSKTNSSDALAASASVAKVISISGDNPFEEFTPISFESPSAVGEKQFSFDLVIRSKDERARQCDGALKVVLNDKTRFEKVNSSWRASERGQMKFIFTYGSFALQKYSQVDGEQTFLKLDCRFLGEL